MNWPLQWNGAGGRVRLREVFLEGAGLDGVLGGCLMQGLANFFCKGPGGQ